MLLYSEPNIDYRGLKALETPPARGRYHQPYPFGQYVDDVLEALDLVGLKPVKAEYEVTPDHMTFFGAMELESDFDDYQLIVGLRGSHNQRIPRGLAVGSQVMVCSNLCFSGDLGEFHTKQTVHLGSRLPTLIRETVERIPEVADAQDRRYAAMREREVSDDQVLVTLGNLVRNDGLSPPQYGKALREWDRPSFDHGDDLSVWRLFNACTQALKPGGERVNHQLIADRSAIIDREMGELAA
jgi:hypothetical protein